MWRVGRKLGRTVYRDDVLVGMMDTAELAQAVVNAMNARTEQRDQEETDYLLGSSANAGRLRESTERLNRHSWQDQAWGMWPQIAERAGLKDVKVTNHMKRADNLLVKLMRDGQVYVAVDPAGLEKEWAELPDKAPKIEEVAARPQRWSAHTEAGLEPKWFGTYEAEEAEAHRRWLEDFKQQLKDAQLSGDWVPRYNEWVSRHRSAPTAEFKVPEGIRDLFKPGMNHWSSWLPDKTDIEIPPIPLKGLVTAEEEAALADQGINVDDYELRHGEILGKIAESFDLSPEQLGFTEGVKPCLPIPCTDDEPEYRDPDVLVDSNGWEICNKCGTQAMAFKDGGWACNCDSAMYEHMRPNPEEDVQTQASEDYARVLNILKDVDDMAKEAMRAPVSRDHACGFGQCPPWCPTRTGKEQP